MCTRTRVCLGHPLLNFKLVWLASEELPMTCLVQLLELRLQGLLQELRGQLFQNQHPDEVVVIDPAAVTLSRGESRRLRSIGEIPKIDFY